MKKRLHTHPYALIIMVLSITACHSKVERGNAPGAATEFTSGADLSYVNQVQDHGGRYYLAGRETDPFTIFPSAGFNTVRVRLWHNPMWTAALNEGKMYGDLADVTRTISRAKSAGMKVNLDLHYSDDWADPHKQATPDVWKGLSPTVLGDSVYRYTLWVLETLHAKGLT
jgi:arabinogalactan endo-1,4-beta-galactosidase